MSRVRFLFLADTQLGCYATFSGLTPEETASFAEREMRVAAVPRVEGFEWDARQYERAVEIVNHVRPDFVAIGGDMIDDANSEDQTEEFLRITATIDSDIPVHWAPGNHDIAIDSVIPTNESIARYRDIFGPDYYRFQMGEATFVILNSVVLDHPENVPTELDTQMAFLEETLAGATGPVVLLMHHPLFVAAPDEPDTYWNIPLARRSRVLDLVHRHGVGAGFAGHWHRNAYAADGDFEMVTSGPVGYPLGIDPSGYRDVSIVDGTIRHAYHSLEDPGGET